jgi:hypothetical protein
MPSELPREPSETHQTLLRRGTTEGLSLQAYEVAEYTKEGRLLGLTVLGSGLLFGFALLAFVLFILSVS